MPFHRTPFRFATGSKTQRAPEMQEESTPMDLAQRKEERREIASKEVYLSRGEKSSLRATYEKIVIGVNIPIVLNLGMKLVEI